MSHNRRKTASNSNGFEGMFYIALLACLAIFLMFSAMEASAATNPGTKVHKNPTYILKSTLEDLSVKDEAVLDWRTQSFDLAFDLPSHDWYESLDLFLSVTPDGNVSKSSPLMISYNGAKAIALNGHGSRFDAHIRLDPGRIRSARNIINISYKTPPGANCLTDAHGKWLIDLSHSKLVARVRAKPRDMQIFEIEQRLGHPMTAPKRVALLVKGPNKLALEALAAQGVAQRSYRLTTLSIYAGCV